MAKGTSAPKNEGGEQTPAPDESTPTGDPQEQGTEAQPQTDPVPPNETITGTESAEASVPVVENRATPQQGVMINGKLETDWTVINQHFAALNQAQEEQKRAHRQSFVEGLAAANKIPAPMVDNLTKFVLGDENTPGLSDEQFEAFAASYESATPLALFNEHAATESTTAPGTPTATSAKNERVGVLEGILAMHRRGGMTEDQIKNTQSYIELQSLLGNNES